MKRREWLASSLAASTFAGLSALDSPAQAQEKSDSSHREVYALKRYQLRNGPQLQLMNDFLRQAAVPALNRAQVKPVGVFQGVAGPENPAIYVLIPYPSLAALMATAERLAGDDEYQRRAGDYLNAPASQPAYIRFETFLLHAFETVPHIEVPPAASESRPRIFELRTYENPSEKANQTKLKMFNTAEIAIFRRTGLRPVFFGNCLIGSRMPHLTYMLTFDDMTQRERNWAAFRADPEWKKLSSTPGYTDVEIITNITNIFLSPAPYSQV